MCEKICTGTFLLVCFERVLYGKIGGGFRYVHTLLSPSMGSMVLRPLKLLGLAYGNDIFSVYLSSK